MKLFVVTWGWLTLEDRKEQRHAEAADCYRQKIKVPGSIITSDFVLDETITRLFRRRPFHEAWRFTQGLLDSAEKGFVRIEPVTEARFRKALELRQGLSDKPRISFTDLSSMVIMKELEVRDALTADAHFRQVGLGFRTLPD